MSVPLIELQSVSKTFATRAGATVAVDDVSLTVHRGEVLTIVGPSGCGKSTVLNMVAGFTRPSAGRILLDGVEIAGVEPRCGMVFQSYALFPWMTVLENVAFGPRLKGQRASERRELARRWLGRVGLEGFEHAYPGELSGGMQQRVALCRALANEPEVLLCDEVTSALDPISAQRIESRLKELKDEYTIVLVTHVLRQARNIADYVIFMYLGELIEHGPAEQVFGNPQQPKTRAYLEGKLY